MPLTPGQAARRCLQRAQYMLDAALKKVVGENAIRPTVTRNDLRRMALVMGVTAIDTYMHLAVLRKIGEVRMRDLLPKPLGQLDMPFDELASLADAAIGNQRAETRGRPWVQVKNALYKRLLKETFQSSGQVARAMSMAGITEIWRKLSNELGESAESIRSRLDGIVHRRNQIVHEGDYPRNVRPRRITYNPISPRDVRQDLEWLTSLIAALDVVTGLG